MIEITNIRERAPRAVAKAQRTKPFVTKLDDRTYKVVPRFISKQKRIVTFTIRDGKRFADCRAQHTGEQCPAVENGFICYHISAACRRAESNRLRRLARRAAAVVQPVAAATVPKPSLPSWIYATKIRGIRI